MLFSKTLTKCLALTLCVALAGQSMAAAPAKAAANVALTQSRSLTGILVDTEGERLADTAVAIRQNDKTLQTVQTSGDGSFEFSNLSTGVYQLRTPHGVNNVRVFNNEIAPATAKEGVLLVNGDKLVRGGPIAGAGPLAVIVTVVVVVVAAVIIAEEADDDDPLPSP